jgi:hypothetical protein
MNDPREEVHNLRNDLQAASYRWQITAAKLEYARSLLTRLLPYAADSSNLPDVLGTCQQALCDNPACVRCTPWKTYLQVLDEARTFLQTPSV